jgi:site-specific DNA-methyltransferase (adenine-specific)
MTYLVETYTRPGETVLDFTMGSGTTGAACAHLGRRFIGIEIVETFFDIACTRLCAIGQ